MWRETPRQAKTRDLVQRRVGMYGAWYLISRRRRHRSHLAIHRPLFRFSPLEGSAEPNTVPNFQSLPLVLLYTIDYCIGLELRFVEMIDVL